MVNLGQLAKKIRSKNAGPFWITVDIFCGDEFNRLVSLLDTNAIATLLHIETDCIKRFDIKALSVIKISFPRTIPQGNLGDRDMHGAQIATLFAELNIEM